MQNLAVPIFTQLLENRPVSAAIVGAAILHGGLTLLGLPSWQCPIRHTLGIPCPGCGLSRAMGALLEGDWQTALTYHAFAPLFLAGLLALGLITLMPAPHRHHTIHYIHQFELRTKAVAIGLVAFLLYWLVRLLFFQEAFIHLIMG